MWEATLSQEDAMNMSDEQALKILKPMRDMMRDQHGCPISDAYFALKRAIDALSAQQWIPCSERLPEEDGLEVLFSSRFGRVHIGKYHDDASLNRWFSYRDKIRLMNDEVTAWMPLQEPYREEAADG